MDIAIDLGSCRTRFFIENKGKVLDEASVIAYDADTEEIYEIGDKAYSMIGKTPVGINAIHPMECGVIAQSQLASQMISGMFKKCCNTKIVMPRVVTSVSCDISEVEKRAIVNAVSSFGARKVYLIESPKAAALGCGIDITSPHGVLIADIGGGTADIAVLSLGGIAVSKTLRKAGSAMDDEIIKYMRKKHGLIIGKNMAESCKKTVGCVKIPTEPKQFKVKGRDAVTGLPKYIEADCAEIKEAIEETALEIVSAVKSVLESTPPELIGDIYSDGIILTGGLAKLTGFAKLISECTKIKVRVHKSAQDCVIMGCGKAIQYISLVEKNKSTSVSPLITAY